MDVWIDVWCRTGSWRNCEMKLEDKIIEKKELFLLISFIFTSILSLLFVRLELPSPLDFILIYSLLIINVIFYLFIVKNCSINKGIIASIIFSISLKLLLVMRQPDGIAWNSWAYFWNRTFEATINSGYLKELSSSVVSTYTQFPATILFYSIIKSLTGMDFSALFKYIIPFVYSIVVFPMYYYFTKNNFNLNDKLCLIGLVILNSCFVVQRHYEFTYHAIGIIFFVLSLHYIFNKDTKKKYLGLLFAGILLFTHHYSFVVLCGFIFVYYIYFNPKNEGRVFPLLLCTLIAIGLISVIIKTYSTYSKYISSALYAFSTFFSRAPAIPFTTNPHFDLIRLIPYIGPAILLLLSGWFFFFNMKSKKSWLLLFGWGVYITFVFLIPWNSKQLIAINDLRFRTVEFVYLLIIPLMLMVLHNFFSITKRKRGAYLILGIILGSVIFSIPLENISGNTNALPSDNSVFPSEYYSLAVWSESNLPTNSLVFGGYRSTYIWAMSGKSVVYQNAFSEKSMNNAWTEHFNDRFLVFDNKLINSYDAYTGELTPERYNVLINEKDKIYATQNLEVYGWN